MVSIEKFVSDESDYREQVAFSLCIDACKVYNDATKSNLCWFPPPYIFRGG